MTRARSTRPALVGLLVVALAAVAALVAATRGGDRAPTARIIRGAKFVGLLPEWDAGSVELHAMFAAGRAAKPAAKAFAEFLEREIPGLVDS